MPQAETPSRFLEAFNRADAKTASEMLAPVIERSPWLVERIVAARPFAGAADLAAHLAATLIALPPADRLRLLRAHPELAPPAPEAMTAASQHEQGRVDLARPSREVAERLAELNRRYAQRHGFPFIIALHAQEGLDAIFAQFGSRLNGEPELEQARALAEVVSVAQARLARLTRPVTASEPASEPAPGLADPAPQIQ